MVQLRHGDTFPLARLSAAVLHLRLRDAYLAARVASNKNQVRRSASSIQISSRLAVATSPCSLHRSCVSRMRATSHLLSSRSVRRAYPSGFLSIHLQFPSKHLTNMAISAHLGDNARRGRTQALLSRLPLF